MYKRHILGKEGEQIATDYLKQNNYKILLRNFRCNQGEIDIIAKNKNEIVFIEVKTRQNNNFGNPAEAVTKIKRKHILDTAKYYIYKNNLGNMSIRFDVIEIYKKEKFYINHIKNINIKS